MTTAREKAEAFAASCLYGADNSDAITHAARQLLAIIDKRFAELREKEKEGCTQVGSSSRSLSGPCSETSFDGGQIKIDDWEPTEEQAGDIAESHAFGTVAHIVRAAMKEGRRIAREDQCSQSGLSQDSRSSQSAQPSTTSVGNAASDTTTATAGTTHALQTPATEATTKSLDARAEALFAANPEWRPRSNDQSLSLQFHEGHWTWLSINWFSVDHSPATANAHLLSALLPRAIEKWWSGSRHIESSSSVFGWKLTRAFSSGPPRDLESAINILEWA